MTVYSQIQINGSEVPNVFTSTVRKSTSDNNSISTFSTTINNYVGSYADNWVIGDNVEVYADVDINPPTTKIFNGILEEIKFDGKENNERLILKGKDFSVQLIDRTVEPEVYTNLVAGSIVKDIISKYTDDITVNNVQDSATTISRIAFNQTPVFDAIKQLADLSDSVFYVDNDKDLHFNIKSQTSSGKTFDNTNVLKAKFREVRNSVYNEIWVYGDRYLDGFIENFIGTGSTSAYTLINKPHNTDITVDGVAQKGAIQNMIIANTVSGVDYTVGFNDKLITFQSGADIGYDANPGSNAAVVMNYMRDLPIVKVGKDNDSIAKYGKRVKIIEDDNIKDAETAQELLASELAENSIPKKEGQINIKGIVDVTPSNTCIVNIPFHDVNNKVYDIVTASYNFDRFSKRRDDVLILTVNKKLPDVTDTIKEMILDIKKLQSANISDSDTLTRFEFTTGSFGVRQSGLFVSSRNLTGSTLYYAEAGIGTDITGTMASGTLQGVLAGSQIGSPYSPYSVLWSGGFV